MRCLFFHYFFFFLLYTVFITTKEEIKLKKTRQAHLWIGLISSVLILMESITGLLLTEPWLMGGKEKEGIRVEQHMRNSSSPSQQMPQKFKEKKGNTNSFSGFVKQLHTGRIGNTDISWALDITSIAMIFLTASGIYLSIKILMAQRKSKKRKKEKAKNAE